MARFLAAFLLIPTLGFAQALPNLNLLSVRYNSDKTAAKPEGELRAQLDEVDKAIADARRVGNGGEIRRQLAKGMTLLRKEAWTPALDYRNSVVLRSDRTVADSSAPYTFRLEQIYRPSTELSANLTAKVSIRKRDQEPRELGTFD